jgi:nucleotide-binding universal stress UspA family protein
VSTVFEPPFAWSEDVMEERYGVVVGVDGSPESLAALRFALNDAARRRTGVKVVSAYVPPEYWAVSYSLTTLPAPEDLAADCAQVGREAIAAAVAADPEIGSVPTEVIAVPGPAAKALIDQAGDADLLVVGHRGRGGFKSAVLGSVGLHCALHATCPVTIVRPERVAAPAPRLEEPQPVFVPIY